MPTRTEQLPVAEMQKIIAGATGTQTPAVFILGCNGCARLCGTGGPDEVAAMASQLESTLTITGCACAKYACDKEAALATLDANQEAIEAADAILVLACDSGVAMAEKCREAASIVAGLLTLGKD